jgi:hypothetical protein
MKTLLNCACLVSILLLASFVTQGKQRKITLPLGNHVGHVQWVKVTPYQAVKDSCGSIVKAAPNYGFGNIASWTYYDEYGNEIENDQYDSKGNKHGTRHEYYPNGDIKEIIKDSNVRTAHHTVVSDHREHYAGWGRHTWYTYKYKNFDTKYNNRYDASGNLLYSEERTYDSGSTRAFSCNLDTYFYDKYGKMLEKFTFNNWDTINPNASTLFRYNEKGQLTEEDESRRTGSPGYTDGLEPTVRAIFKRNAKGMIIDEATYRFKGGLIKENKITFDNSGDTLEMVETDYTGIANNNSLTGSEVSKFFKKTHILLEDKYDGNGMLTYYNISHFDSEKHLLDWAQFHITPYSATREDTVMVHHIINDGHFNVIEDDGFSNAGIATYKFTRQYKYDKVGNWVEQLSITKGIPETITEREIQYFAPNHKT